MCFFDISEKTLNAWCKRTYKAEFSLVFSQKRGKGENILKGAYNSGWQKKMLIWLYFLGKNYLGQTDKIETTDTEALKNLMTLWKK